MLILDGREHLRQRKLLLAPFQGSRVSAFREVIREVAEREIASWQPGAQLVLRERMRSLTFEVICRAVFGVTEPDRVERLRRRLVAVIDSSPVFMIAPAARADLGSLSPGGRFVRRPRAADAVLYAEIERRRLEPDLDARSDVLSLLLRARDEQGQAMTDVELRDELFTMLGAGHETTATGLAFAFELLLRNPPVLARLREDLYPHAREFRPERFLDDGAESYSWLPFGGGIRRCIGAALAHAEMAEVLRVAVPRVALRPLREQPDPVVLRGVTLAPKHGVQVTVGSRAPGWRRGAREPASASADRTPDGAPVASSRVE